jgi:pullulanase/glycogen debranching enzyme
MTVAPVRISRSPRAISPRAWVAQVARSSALAARVVMPSAATPNAEACAWARRPTISLIDDADACWVRERRIESVPRSATLHTELGSWPLLDGAVPAEVPVREVLKGRLRVDEQDVQIAGVLDDLYAAAAVHARLGPVWKDGRPSLAVWAPTARDVALRLREERVPMDRGDDGVWRITGDASWRDAEYAFEVTVFAPSLDKVVTNVVTDPYSIALARNSRRSLLAELPPPDDWPKPAPLNSFCDATIYELHIRDFSIGDMTVPEAHRGTYLAFTHTESDGMRHLRALAEAGITTVHLLPCNDIATLEEDRSKHLDPGPLDAFAPDSAEQQRRVGEVRDCDGFNWGYDPLHFTTPEGSYAVDPAQRTNEFRAMVRALNAIGLHVVLDVVYNHTAAAGQHPRSILDRIVPGYYHRWSKTGALETSTCCANTASERPMMEKLMLDSLATWAREYRVDGFRFDLMGHHTKANLLAARERLGPELHLYGEGWSFGEVADDALFVAASQKNMAGTGIGTFNDRLRDAVRGGGPHDDDPRAGQGFATGLADEPSVALASAQHQIQLGLAGQGYALRPDDAIAYVDAHDNETLFDTLALKLPQHTSMDDRVRMNTLALAIPALGQSPCFWHAGADLLRSKSLDRNSYDSGDWFNRIDWTATRTTWGAGLPPAWDNEARWPLLRPLLADPALKPAPHHIRTARDRAHELLRIRFSSPLFRLGDPDLIRELVRFEPGSPGVIVMVLAGELVVVFNASPRPTTQAVESRARRLHPLLAERESSYAGGAFTVAARTVAVFLP